MLSLASDSLALQLIQITNYNASDVICLKKLEFVSGVCVSCDSEAKANFASKDSEAKVTSGLLMSSNNETSAGKLTSGLLMSADNKAAADKVTSGLLMSADNKLAASKVTSGSLMSADNKAAATKVTSGLLSFWKQQVRKIILVLMLRDWGGGGGV